MPSSYTLGDHFEQFIKKQLASGQYQNASEVVRASLRLMEERDRLYRGKLDALRADIREGLNSGPGDVWDLAAAKRAGRARRAARLAGDSESTPPCP